MTTVLDHLAIGARDLSGGWELFGGLLGGTWAYGGNSAGFWWGQLEYPTWLRLVRTRLAVDAVEGSAEAHR